MNDSLPPDRGQHLTEQRLAASADLDTLDTMDVLRLINAQDASIASVVAAAMDALAPLVEATVEALQADGRLIYLGAGTSGRLGVLDASECPPTFQSDPAQVIGLIAGGDGALRRSSEGREDEPDGAVAELERLGTGQGDVVVGIAAGGTTPYVLGGLAHARASGAVTALICCVRVQAEVDHIIELPVGPEVVTGSTRMKAGTATKMVLNMLTTTTMVRLGKTWGNLMVDLRATNAKLVDRAVRILMSQCDLDRPAALALLERGGGQVKTALVMHHRQLTADQARQLLATHHHRLRPLLGDPAGGEP